MKKSIIIATILALTGSVYAECYGTGSLKKCQDDKGNSYTIEKYGTTTIVSGRNSRTGSVWNKTVQTHGNTTYINGIAANGNSWNETIKRYGDTTYISGTDSDGNSFSKNCYDGECY